MRTLFAVAARSATLAAAVLGLAVCAVWSASLQQDVGFLWIAQSEGLLNIATDTGDVRFERPNTGGYSTAAVNDVNGDVWAFRYPELVSYTRFGSEQVRTMVLPSAEGEAGVSWTSTSLGIAPDIVVDGISGSVWLAAGYDLRRFTMQGELEQSLSMIDPGQWPNGVVGDATPIVAITLDRPRGHLWVATESQLRIYDAQGDLLTFKTFAEAPSQVEGISDIAYDRHLDEVWMATERIFPIVDAISRYRVSRLDAATVQETFEAAVETASPIAPDGSGGLWFTRPSVEGSSAHHDQLGHISEQGIVEQSFIAFPVLAAPSMCAPLDLNCSAIEQLGDDIVDVVSDPKDASVWAASLTRIRHFAIDGDVLHDIDPSESDGVVRKLVRASLYSDLDPPELQFTAPLPGSSHNTNVPAFSLSYFDLGVGVDPDSFTFKIDGALAAFSCTTSTTTADCVPVSGLSDGDRTVTATILDREANTSAEASRTVHIDTVPLQITVTQPKDGAFTNQASVMLEGFLDVTAALTINGEAVVLSPSNTFSFETTLAEGVNSFALSATDIYGNTGGKTVQVTLDTHPPSQPDADLIHFDLSGNGESVVLSGSAGAVEGGADVLIVNVRTGSTVTVTSASDGSFSAELDGVAGDELLVGARDRATNESSRIGLALLPPDPVTIASPLSASGITPFKDSTAFLLGGLQPIQTGVSPGTIAAIRGSVVRGRVLDRSNNPIAGAEIYVEGHPEYGQTLSRADGMFDLAVNGGGQLTLSYQKSGYLPIQRYAHVPWRDYALMPDVVMVPLDSAVTRVNLDAAGAALIARGSPVSDADGKRQATLLFMPGTTAQLVMPGGQTQAISTMNVRATEYTVGVNGPRAMPGPLPPSSGYTYAVELSADEAVAAGATSVQFSQPVSLYVDNFLNFPVGTAVPSGWYDQNKSAWIPSDDGIVIVIITIEDGLAVLGIAEGGLPATPQELLELGITPEELQALAASYLPGTELWRVPITHFTPWDCNWPFGPPDDAEAPEPPSDEDEEELEEPNCKRGSVVECQNQILGESIPIAATDFSLNYRSDRVPGATNSYSAGIRLSGSTVPASLKRIELDIEVAGQQHKLTFPAAPDQNYQFGWDGEDVYGRSIVGAVSATIRIGYVYEAVYRDPSGGGRSFSQPGGTQIAGSRTRQEVTLSRLSPLKLVRRDARAVGLGGWMLSAHHVYDAAEGVLYQGDGTKRGVGTAFPTIGTVAGTGIYGPIGDGGLATSADIGAPEGVAAVSDGGFFIADSWGQRIRRVAPNGTITSVAGTGASGYSGDGGPATQAELNDPYSVALGPGGDIYIGDTENAAVRRVATDGTITTVAGTGVEGFSGDGGSATQAQLGGYVTDVAVASDGTLYVADSYNNRIRRVGTDGIITTFAGDGSSTDSGDGGPATQAGIWFPYVVELGPDGSVYIGDSGRVRRVTPDGVITTVAGNGSYSTSGDGGPATQAAVGFPEGITFGADGSLYISGEGRVRRVGPDGIISTIAGTGAEGFNGDGWPAAQSELWFPHHIATDPEGGLLLADVSNGRIRRIAGAFPRYRNEGIDIASDDGTELYRFDETGKHLSTVDTTTGASIYTFAYDADGYLVQVTDQDGDVTTIERAGRTPTAIVSADGHRTDFTVDANGFLETSKNPAVEQYSMTSSSGGLLETFTNPRGYSSTFTYEGGRLAKDENAGGGSLTLVRNEQPAHAVSTVTTAFGRASTYEVEYLPTGDERRTNTDADGTVELSTRKASGEKVTVSDNGTVTTILHGPDPRFGMLSPLPASVVVETPDGLSLTSTTAANVSLADPGDPLSMTGMVKTVTVNGRASTAEFDANSRTWNHTSPVGRQRTTTLTSDGRVAAIQVADFEAATYTYDAKGRLDLVTVGTGPASRSTDFTYYSGGPFDGFLQTIIDAENRTLSFDDYDLAGRVKKQTLPGAREVHYSYDENGNLTALTPPAQPLHAFDYTAVDLNSRYTPPEATNVGFRYTNYDYNVDKDLELITLPDGQTIDLVYSGPGQKLSAVTAPWGSYALSYQPTSGQLDSITAPSGVSLSYTYDGFLTKSENLSGPVSGTVAWGFNNNFLVSSQSVNGLSIAVGYDNDGLLTSVGGLTLTRHATRGLVSTTSLGNVTTSYDYNVFGELSAESAAYSGTSIYQESFPVRDKLGRIRERVETIDGMTSTYGYTYDSAGHVETVTRNGTTISTYIYDDNGNRRFYNSTEGTYDAQDRLLTYGSASYTYTANGELLTRTESGLTTTYGYDAFGNLRTVAFAGGTTLDYVVDGRNRRVGKKVNGTLVQGFLYQDQLNPVAELNGSGVIVSRFIYAEKANVPSYMIRGGQTYRIVSDHLGSPRSVVNASTGAIVQRMDYDEFGNVITDTNPGFQPFGFAGGIYDLHTGFVRFGARDYDARVGRWTAKDPIGFGGGDANMYAYVWANPLSSADPNGLGPWSGIALGLVCMMYEGSDDIADTASVGDLAAEVQQINRLIETAEGACPVERRPDWFQDYIDRLHEQRLNAVEAYVQQNAGMSFSELGRVVGCAAAGALVVFLPGP
jgi:RHS repeat-associated protein